VQQFLVIAQLPYFPDLAPSAFWLFCTTKMGLKGTCFATMEDIKSNAMAEFQKIPKEAYCRFFQQWQDQWSMCMRAHGLGKLCCTSYHYSAIPQFLELSDCPSYLSVLWLQ
jgi:hypothetical protein